MSGLFSAAFLRQIGWDVDVYERSPVELEGRGAVHQLAAVFSQLGGAAQ